MVSGYGYTAALTAALALASCEVWSTNNAFGSAIASTEPLGVCFSFNETQNHPFPEPLAGQVYEPRVAPSRIVGSHDVSFLHQRRLWLEPAGRSTAPLARPIIAQTLAV